MRETAAFTPSDGNDRDDFAKIDRAAKLDGILGANLCRPETPAASSADTIRMPGSASPNEAGTTHREHLRETHQHQRPQHHRNAR